MCRIIKKTLLKDSNVAVITEAVMAAAALAKGLRREFRHEAKTLTPALLDKFKDKTTNLVRQISTTLTAFQTHCVGLSDLSDDLLAAFDHKVPKVQIESLGWTAAAAAGLDKAAGAKLHKEFVPAVCAIFALSPLPSTSLPGLAALVSCGEDHRSPCAVWCERTTARRSEPPPYAPLPGALQMLRLAEAADPAVRNAALSVLASLAKAGGGYGAIGAPSDLTAHSSTLSLPIRTWQRDIHVKEGVKFACPLSSLVFRRPPR